MPPLLCRLPEYRCRCRRNHGGHRNPLADLRADLHAASLELQRRLADVLTTQAVDSAQMAIRQLRRP